MGAPGIVVVGDGVNNVLRGTAGDDSFDGSLIGEIFYTGLGNDVVYASGGDDNVIADLGNDWLDGGSGTDFLNFSYVNSSTPGHGETSSFSIKLDLAKTVQNLGYYGTKTLYNFEDATGTVGDDQIFGNSKNNRLHGEAGNDRLDGRDGNDRLTGYDGNDSLIGGSGDDVLAGGLGSDKFYAGTGKDVLSGYIDQSFALQDFTSDRFVYSSTRYSGTSEATRDVIYGYFSGAGSDKIDLSGIDANGSKSGDGKFAFIGGSAFHSNSTSEVQVKFTGNDNQYLVSIDTDSDNKAEMQLLVFSDSMLTASDFIL